MIVEIPEIVLAPDTSLRQGLEVLEKARVKVLLLVDENNVLIGTCTDGDFRRALLQGVGFSAPISDIANLTPITITKDMPDAAIERLMRDRNIIHVPAIDENGVLIGLHSGVKKVKARETITPVVIMAGGLGTRLQPLTNDCPKPLLPIGGKPMLQHIIGRLSEQGFKRFFLSTNYLGHMIEDYFGSGKNMGVEISYLKENKRLGTGGALSLLPRSVDSPVVVVNGDVITDIDMTAILKTHENTNAVATMGVREYKTTIPFGVVNFEGNSYSKTVEKPTLSHFINAGIYCLSREALSVVPADTFYDMPTMFQDLVKEKMNCSIHLLDGGWWDVGSHAQYKAIQSMFEKD